MSPLVNVDDIKTVAVIGCGTMGAGIAHVFAQTGHNVILVDQSDELLGKAVAAISKNLARQVKKEKITEDDSKTTLERITTTKKIKDAGSAQLVIEAVFEDKEVKTSIFEGLADVCDSQTIFASNTSSLPITQLASASGRPDKFIGMHFMNPVPVMKLIELIRGVATSAETFETVRDLSIKLGKTPVEVNDYPGFVANRILMPMINEAVYAVMEGVSSVEDIDTVMKLGMNHPMGPLTLADFIGLDECLAIMETLYDGFPDSKYRPRPLLRKMVHAGYLGSETGRGFYTYEE